MPTSTLPEVIQQQQENVQQLSAAAAGAVDPDEDEENADYQDSFFSTGPPYHKRAFNEIVSSVQGSFDFLQESHLDVECKCCFMCSPTQVKIKKHVHDDWFA